MTGTVLEKYGTNIQELMLVPSGGGVFEITLNNKLIFSKRKLDRFPKDGEIIDLINSENRQ